MNMQEFRIKEVVWVVPRFMNRGLKDPPEVNNMDDDEQLKHSNCEKEGYRAKEKSLRHFLPGRMTHQENHTPDE
jgi:hypothetical protein